MTTMIHMLDPDTACEIYRTDRRSCDGGIAHHDPMLTLANLGTMYALRMRVPGASRRMFDDPTIGAAQQLRTTLADALAVAVPGGIASFRLAELGNNKTPDARALYETMRGTIAVETNLKRATMELDGCLRSSPVAIADLGLAVRDMFLRSGLFAERTYMGPYAATPRPFLASSFTNLCVTADAAGLVLVSDAGDRLALMLMELDLAAWPLALVEPPDSHPLMAGADVKTETGKRLRERATYANVSSLLVIYRAQLCRWMLEMWRPFADAMAASTDPVDKRLYDEVVAKWYRSIADVIPLHGLLASVLPDGASQIRFPDGEGRAYWTPYPVDDLVAMLPIRPGVLAAAGNDRARAATGEPWYRLAPWYAGLRHPVANATSAARGQELSDYAREMEVLMTTNPGLIDTVRSLLPFAARASVRIPALTWSHDRAVFGWTDDEFTSVEPSLALTGHAPVLPVNNDLLRPFVPTDTVVGTMPFTFMTIEQRFVRGLDPAAVVRPPTVDDLYNPPRIRGVWDLLGEVGGAVSLSSAAAAYARLAFIDQAAARDVITNALTPYVVSPTTQALSIPASGGGCQLWVRQSGPNGLLATEVPFTSIGAKSAALLLEPTRGVDAIRTGATNAPVVPNPACAGVALANADGEPFVILANHQFEPLRCTVVLPTQAHGSAIALSGGLFLDRRVMMQFRRRATLSRQVMAHDATRVAEQAEGIYATTLIRT